jgi:tripartite-type tricarboxylate transporter receptor subunit TctC
VAKIVHDKETKERLLKQCAEPVGSAPEQSAALARAEYAKWAKVIRGAGIKLD